MLTTENRLKCNKSHDRGRFSTLGQPSSGSIEVLENRLQIEVTLPWLLAKFAERIGPTIRKEATLLLEKK